MNAEYTVYNTYCKGRPDYVTVSEVEICPLCHKAGHPHFVGGIITEHPECEDECYIFIVLQCLSCHEYFFVTYASTENIDEYELISIYPKQPEAIEFDKIIEDISSDFVKIYTQASLAEAQGFDELVGIGYRKALEFLVKDYLIYNDPSQSDVVETLSLGDAIDKLPGDELQDLARGASWIGNDETHYTRRNPNYDVTHLKLFIQSFVALITHRHAVAEARKLLNSRKK